MSPRVGVVPVLLVLASCSSSSSDPTGAADASASQDASSSDSAATVDAATMDAPTTDATDAGACNALDNIGTTVTQTQIADALPAWMGGTIVDGTYVLTAEEVYTGTGGATGPTGQTLKQTLRIASGVIDEVREVNGTIHRATMSYTVTGIVLAETQTCPPAPTFLWRFTATPTTFAWAPNGTISREVFTLQ